MNTFGCSNQSKMLNSVEYSVGYHLSFGLKICFWDGVQQCGIQQDQGDQGEESRWPTEVGPSTHWAHKYSFSSPNPLQCTSSYPQSNVAWKQGTSLVHFMQIVPKAHITQDWDGGLSVAVAIQVSITEVPLRVKWLPVRDAAKQLQVIVAFGKDFLLNWSSFSFIDVVHTEHRLDHPLLDTLLQRERKLQLPNGRGW